MPDTLVDFMGYHVLGVFAHHDDETLSAGATFARLVDDDCAVHLAVLGEGPTARPEGGTSRVDYWNATALLGAANRYSHPKGFPDNRFDEVALLDTTRTVEMLLEKYQPRTVITHWPHDLNVDHRAVCQAVLTATRPTPGQRVRAVYAAETPSSTEWAYGGPAFSPTTYVSLTEAQMERKHKALACYQSELREYPHPRSHDAIDALARYRGSQCGHPWAEAFMLLREIRA
jgi:LmbE family N-acetylglucosaminyl deacetylase